MRARISAVLFKLANRLDELSMKLNRIGMDLLWGKNEE
jgi:hypothetical protein